MSTAVVRAEIERFIQSSAPEVLCISGQWGVGKTYSWQTFLKEAERVGRVGLSRYAYVSLFGLTSLGELRNAIVENTVNKGSSSVPDASSLHEIIRKGETFARKSRPALEIAAGFFRMKDAGDALYREAFLTVRNQLICFDDLERAGKALEMRDILGLTSMLREQRHCKVVLLLNKEQTKPEEAKELQRQLEKVVDTFLLFEPTSAEAAAIAIVGTDPVAEKLRDRLVALGVTNMRVMKKIERWARLIETEVVGVETEVVEQAVVTVVLAGWCFLQPDLAPGLDFVREFNSTTGLFRREDEPEERKKWREILSKYGYRTTDELDAAIIDGVAIGYFRGDDLRAAAQALGERLKRNRRKDSFSLAWELFHSSLTTDDDVILDAMVAGAMENLGEISPVNMNSGVRFLRRYGREAQASELVVKYIDANRSKPDFFSKWNRFFHDDPVDEELLAAMEAERTAIVDARDPAEMLKQMARTSGYNPDEDSARLSRLTADELVQLFDGNAADDVKGMMEWADRLASHPGALGMRASLDEALARIAARSPMRADRLRSWGVLPANEKPDGPDADPAASEDAAADAAAVTAAANNDVPTENDGGEEKPK
ncbi:hypothetical protein GCM10008023_36510 [Sphingomonas glacialis]|uniref:KAP NTPase domain-containing protein n=1 Tax=Sphingomonas glacialis TaxID=658225 RepID=A0ABQ3LRR3_9SPHN|nr:hypothetical protein [Sphingomonas glacialis]GHH24382.1 hypothetical protein GCM10008023_36510 [Sphingomonas glacialis]